MIAHPPKRNCSSELSPRVGDNSRGNRLCGVDISEPMLRKAQQRVDELGLTNVEGLWVMDAEPGEASENAFQKQLHAVANQLGGK